MIRCMLVFFFGAITSILFCFLAMIFGVPCEMPYILYAISPFLIGMVVSLVLSFKGLD